MNVSRSFLSLSVAFLSLVACADETPTETISFTPATVAGEIPCNIDKLLAVCRNCHSNPTKNGAPFPLLKLGDVRGAYLGKSVASRASSALKTKFMPQPPLDKDFSDADRKFLSDWFDMGAPADAGCK